MKVKLSNITINTSIIKELHNKKQRLHSGLNKTIKPKYSIEFVNGTFLPINKQEYKIVKKVLDKVEKE